MSLKRTLKFITSHPLNKGRPIRTLLRFLVWQVQSRLQREVVFDWIDGAQLVVQPGMTGATGNIYCGLHEYQDMSFFLHLLRPDDLFVDVGANIGSYTILASSVVGTEVISVEPDPETFQHLTRNVQQNSADERVDVKQFAVGSEEGEIAFTVGQDTTNQVADKNDPNAQILPMSTLDALIGDRSPVAIKMDVEGFETEVLRGATATLAKPSLVAIEIETQDPEGRRILQEAGFSEYAYDPASRQLSENQAARSVNSLFLRNVPEVEKRLKTAPRRYFRGAEI